MADYTATDDLTALVATNPTAAEDAGKVDDVLRESRRVFKAVLGKTLYNKGEQRVAIFRVKPSSVVAGAGYPAPPGVNTWHTKQFSRTFDDTQIDQSVSLGIVKPIAGVYQIHGYATGFRINRHQIRLFNVTDNVPIAQLYGTLAFSASALDTGSTSDSLINGIITTDGTLEYRLEHIHQTNNTTNGWGCGNVVAWSSEMHFGGLTIRKIG